MPFDPVSYAMAMKAFRQPVTRDRLEYPKENVSFAYLACIDQLVFCSHRTWGVNILTREVFIDKAVFGAVQVNEHSALVGRVQNRDNFYITRYNPYEFTADHFLEKYVRGITTRLGTEAIDIDGSGRGLMLSCQGSTIRSMRFEMPDILDPRNLPTPDYTITVTDTAFSSGRFGYRNLREWYPHGGTTPDCVYLMPPGSPSPKVISYFEVPVIGSGTMEDPFRPWMPEEIVDHSIFGKVNRCALSCSALINTGSDGKPTEYRAIVRVFEQPERQPHLRPISHCISSIMSKSGVRRLDRDESLREAKRLDDKLKDIDLIEW